MAAFKSKTPFSDAFFGQEAETANRARVHVTPRQTTICWCLACDKPVAEAYSHRNEARMEIVILAACHGESAERRISDFDLIRTHIIPTRMDFFEPGFKTARQQHSPAAALSAPVQRPSQPPAEPERTRRITVE